MNLKQLFELQKKLDERIVKEKGLEGQDLLPKKILALQVELGELATEWRGFKFWSNRQSPSKNVSSTCKEDEADYFFCGICHEEYNRDYNKENDGECIDCSNCLMPMKKCNPLLEEYVDCLHFILSIGLEVYCELDSDEAWKTRDIVTQFIVLNESLSDVWENPYVYEYSRVFHYFIGLGEMFGFTWEQIEQAYMDKNKVNHERQSNGY